jgi:O-antigen/teichoic acid export membrane protein
LNFIKKITQTQLFKISTLNSFSVLVRVGVGLITSKVLAVFIGPSGLALVGNFRNFTSSLESLSTLGFQTGIVKYVAESKGSKLQLQKIISTVFISIIVVSVLISGVLFLFSSYFNLKIFGNAGDYQFMFKVFALTLPLIAVSVFLMAVINGLGNYKKVIWGTIVSGIIGLFVSLFLVINYKIEGALLAVFISPALLFFVVFYLLNKVLPFLDLVRLEYFDSKILKNLSSYSLMISVSAILSPLVLITIRNRVITSIGIEAAGYWETITRLSSFYMLFSNTILTVYFYPKLAESKTNLETRKVFRSYYKSILPLFVIGLTAIYFLRFFIIELLFTKEFLPVSSLFFWQLLGDLFKVASLILGFQFFAKKLTVAFIISEIFSFGVLYFLSIYLITIFGIQGVVMAHALDNFIYLLLLGIYFRKSLFS